MVAFLHPKLGQVHNHLGSSIHRALGWALSSPRAVVLGQNLTQLCPPEGPKAIGPSGQSLAPKPLKCQECIFLPLQKCSGYTKSPKGCVDVLCLRKTVPRDSAHSGTWAEAEVRRQGEPPPEHCRSARSLLQRRASRWAGREVPFLRSGCE